MTFKTEVSTIRSIKSGDKDFMISDGCVLTPRAGFEVSTKCPTEYKQIIMSCIDLGWLKPIAFVKDSQLFWEEFSK